VSVVTKHASADVSHILNIFIRIEKLKGSGRKKNGRMNTQIVFSFIMLDVGFVTVLQEIDVILFCLVDRYVFSPITQRPVLLLPTTHKDGSLSSR